MHISDFLKIEKPKAKTEADEIIQEFVDELKKEWQPKYKVGEVWKKRRPKT